MAIEDTVIILCFAVNHGNMETDRGLQVETQTQQAKMRHIPLLLCGHTQMCFLSILFEWINTWVAGIV